MNRASQSFAVISFRSEPSCNQTLIDERITHAFQCMQPLRLARVTRAQTEALFLFADDVAKIVRNPFPRPAITAVRMLPGTHHRKSHCVPPVRTQSGGEKPMTINGLLILLGFFATGGPRPTMMRTMFTP